MKKKKRKSVRKCNEAVKVLTRLFRWKESDQKNSRFISSMGFRWMNVVCFSFWFVLLIEIGDHVTSSLECFECSDFPREDYSEDEEQGTCPGWLRPPRFELPKKFLPILHKSFPK